MASLIGSHVHFYIKTNDLVCSLSGMLGYFLYRIRHITWVETHNSKICCPSPTTSGSFLFSKTSVSLSSSTRNRFLCYPQATFWTRSWSQASSLLPTVTCLHLYHAWGSAFPLFSFPMLVHFHRFCSLHALALSARNFLRKKKSLRMEHEYALGET